jgi:hypothetical protein
MTAFIGQDGLKWFDTYMYCQIPPIWVRKYPNVEALMDSYSFKPAKIYENIIDPKVQAQIRTDTKGKSGVYAFINLLNGKSSVGSAYPDRIYIRFRNHLSHPSLASLLLTRAIELYGIENFIFVILEFNVEKEDFISSTNGPLLRARETFWINFEELYAEYNICKDGGSSLGVKHTEATKEKMKANYSEKRRLMIGDYNRGKR